MILYRRICIQDFTHTDGKKTVEFNSGQTYTVSQVQRRFVTAFVNGRSYRNVPACHFGPPELADDLEVA